MNTFKIMIVNRKNFIVAFERNKLFEEAAEKEKEILRYNAPKISEKTKILAEKKR